MGPRPEISRPRFVTTKIRKGERTTRASGAIALETTRAANPAEVFPLELVDAAALPGEASRPLELRLLQAAKRLLDMVCAAALLILLSPLLIAVAIAIRLESPGSPFFAHRRLGRDGRHFDCLKFRSMRPDAEHLLMTNDTLRHQYVTNDFKIPVDMDPRVTRLGRFLRKSSIDELPQLWNVIKGDMSLVGPRPIVPLEATYYGDDLSLLLSMRPGITGSWAVSGRSEVGYPERVELELEYVRTWSFTTDLEILLRTPVTVFTQRGAL